eukprot:14757580-Alexandrium_andersonii.AAC.1
MLGAFEPGTARAQERPQNGSFKLPTGTFSAMSRAESESAHKRGAWGVQSHEFAQSQAPIRTPPILNPPI